MATLKQRAFLIFFSVYSLIIGAELALGTPPSQADQNSFCKVEFRVFGEREGVCSGTFISRNRFLTAAHCMSHGFAHYPDANHQIHISCPGKFSTIVELAIVNPIFSTPLNDFSILVTRDAYPGSIPVLATTEEELGILKDSNKCFIRGYSKVDLDVSSESHLRSVDLKNGNVPQFQDMISVGGTANGDSGSGIFCLSNAGIVNVIGVLQGGFGANKLVKSKNWISAILNSSDEELNLLNFRNSLDPTYLQKILEVDELLNDVRKMFSPLEIKVELYLTFDRDRVKYLEVMKNLKQTLSDSGEHLINEIKLSKIEEIQISDTGTNHRRNKNTLFLQNPDISKNSILKALATEN